MNARIAIGLGFALLTRFAALNAADAPKTNTRDNPNIVVFLVDDMGVMDTSLPFLTDEAGKPKKYPLNEFYNTPNMEKLANRGVRFSNFCAMSVCSPTRVSLMTGQNSARHRTTNWINPDANNAGPNGPKDWNWTGLTKDNVTLPRLLQADGYRTIHVGKGHFGPRKSTGADPKTIGFDVNIGGSSIGQPGSYYGLKNFGNAIDGKPESSHAVHGLEKYHGKDIFLTEALTLEANAQISEAVKAGKPFYLNFAHYAVHAPFNSDPRFASKYKDSDKPANLQAYASLIEGMDQSLGDLLAQLEKLGVAENTLIFFLGDNGSDAPFGKPHDVASSAPLRGMKGSHYEGGTRAPLIAAWAKPDANNTFQKKLPIASGAVQRQLAAVYDLFPTILAVTGNTIPAKHTIDATRLDKLLTGERDADREEAFLMHFPHAHRSDYFTTYRLGDWKVIYHYFPSAASGNSHYQLFNLAKDPYEQKNLAADEPAELTRMMKGLIAALDQQGALYPVDVKNKEPMKPKLP